MSRSSLWCDEILPSWIEGEPLTDSMKHETGTIELGAGLLILLHTNDSSSDMEEDLDAESVSAAEQLVEMCVHTPSPIKKPVVREDTSPPALVQPSVGRRWSLRKPQPRYRTSDPTERPRSIRKEVAGRV